MYGTAIALSAVTTTATVGMPFFQLGSIGPVQSFGIIVAAGVLIGAALLRRYAEWHGVSDLHIRHLLGWVTICGFLGAHLFDMVAYNWNAEWGPRSEAAPGWWFLPEALWVQNWPLPFRLWEGISSYGGFLGGAMGFAYYVWKKKLPVRLFSDITIVGLLPAFSIGRIGCTVVSDHIGAAVKNPDAWYAWFAMEYPKSLNMDVIKIIRDAPEAAGKTTVLAWNLGLIELLYLIPVNAIILWLAFRPTKRLPAGFVVALTGVLYAPVRFFLEYLRPESSDPRHLGFTFAQWCSIVAFALGVAVAMRVLRKGTPAEVVAPTSGEAQERLRMILKEDEEEASKPATKGKPGGASKKPGDKKLDRREIAKAIAAKPSKDEKAPEQQTPEERKAALLAAIKREKPPEKPAEPDESKSTSKAAADDKPQTAKTDVTAGGSDKPSPNVEQPADEGAEVDPKEAAEAGAAEAAKPSTPASKPKQGGGGGGNKNKKKK